MNLIVGLGNPGKKYAETKHNFGFWIVDYFAEKSDLQFKAGKGDYLFCKTNELMLMKPTTYMNNSGIAVKEACKYFDIEPKDILLVYDEIDLPVGTIRFRSDGGSGGHKGVESVIYQLEDDKFSRLRLGIATDENMRPAEHYVLKPFSKNHKEQAEEVIKTSADSIEYYLSHTIDETMNKFNQSNI
ncbi:MAG: aminoacyl-tRNA hydrolase [Candidatus Marinimicrobia bacterium]|nr:aminoacyl-tRNA hydrolase [Candidatus Neomarinimicrobiota bacterium]MBL7108978.1 aminoacyl-tRNA hydrolase [Candidatus Neomarinimicrobiota bacterium]